MMGRLRVPYPLMFLAIGLALAASPPFSRIQLPPQFALTGFLPALLFNGAATIDFAAVRAELMSIMLLTLLGVLVTTSTVGVAIHVTTGLAWNVALLCSALVAPTDPSAVLTMVGPLGAPRRLTTIVDAESLFNDGVALVLFGALLNATTSAPTPPWTTIIRLMGAIVGAVVLGVSVDILGRAALHVRGPAFVNTALTLLLAYGGYLLANRLGFSGPLETVAAGLVLGAAIPSVNRPGSTGMDLGRPWAVVNALATALLFILMGLALPAIVTGVLDRLGSAVWWPLAVVIVAVIGSRAAVVSVTSLLLASRARSWHPGWRRVIVWAGLRGAVSLAAALSVPRTHPARDLLLALAFGVVLFTLLIQGTTMRALLAHLCLEQAVEGRPVS